ncbi:MAG: LLM class flavin-dependent oxidoreductase, partial [Rhodospirillaceae bacterium]|nr:LLM class flavin-dependent oxidoreductase [Rhodospirillaceae bacterium]
MNPERFDLLLDPLEEGFNKAGNGKSLADFETQPFVPVSLGDDLDACRLPIKQHLALYVGGMGARGKNFYNAYAGRLGYADEARTVQDLFLDGKHKEAVAAVPDALVDDISLIGPRERILDRLEAWKEAGTKRHVTTLVANEASPEALRLLAEELL